MLAFAGYPVPEERGDLGTRADNCECARHRYLGQYDEDMVAMIEDLIRECYPSPPLRRLQAESA